jgi:hypothetical protein
LSTPLFSAIGGLRGIKTKKRNPLNHHCLLNGRSSFFHFRTGASTAFEGRGNY